MRTHFGDYRAKMQAEGKKAGKLDATKVKIAGVEKSDKSKFVKKSASQVGAKSEKKDGAESSNFTFSFNIEEPPKE